MSTRPVDIVFDSREAHDFDNPSFLLRPSLNNVVGYSVIWANVTFSYFTVDLLNNGFMLYMEDDGRAFQNLPAVYSILTAFPRSRIFYRIFCRLNPGTYNPITLSHELKRVFATEPIVEAVRYDPVTGVGEDILPALLSAAAGQGLAAPNSSKFAIEIEPNTNRLMLWNTVHETAFALAIPNPDLAYILGFNESQVSVLPASIPYQYSVTVPATSTVFETTASAQTAISIPGGTFTSPQQVETHFRAAMGLTAGATERFVYNGTTKQYELIWESGISFRVQSGMEAWEAIGFTVDSLRRAYRQTHYGQLPVIPGTPAFPGKISQLDQVWRNGGVISDARDTVFKYVIEQGVNDVVGILESDMILTAGTYTSVDALVVMMDTKIREVRADIKLEFDAGKLKLYDTRTTGRVPIYIDTPHAIWEFLGFDSSTFGTPSTDIFAADFPGVYEPETPLEVQHLYSDHIANLTYSPILNFHSSFANSSLGSARYVNSNESLLIQVPVLSNFGSYIQYQPTNSETPLTRQTITDVDLHVTLGNRRKYSRNGYTFDSEDFETVNFLPLNNEGFQLCIRFFVDDGISVDNK